MRNLIAVLSALLIGWSAFPSALQAQMICGERAKVVQGLEEGYSENPISLGITSSGAVIEVLASKAGTFTIILTQPSGISCLLASGENWERVESVPGKLAGFGV